MAETNDIIDELSDTSNKSNKSGKSLAWKFFKLMESDEKKAICQLCSTVISRGSQISGYTTTNMLKHMSAKHKDDLEVARKKQIEDEKKRKKETECSTSFMAPRKKMKKMNDNLTQPTLIETINSKKNWDINNEKAKRISKLIGEMLATDLQPFSIVEDFGFRRLLKHICPNYQIPCRKYFKENILQDIYQDIKIKLQKEINLAKFISFTSDGWTADTSNISFISLTGHWIDENFDQKTAILRVVPSNEAHTALNISATLKKAMEDFNIPPAKVHVILRDNAANRAAGVAQAEMKSIPCFIHTLQLVLNDAIFTQRYVKDILAVCKQIIGHFNHSPSAFARYEEHQKKLNVPLHKFIQDVKTRWNSQYHMLSRIQEQKIAIISFCSENTKPTCLENAQWLILEKLLKILKNFDDCTVLLSQQNALASAIIPNLEVISHFFEKGEDKGLFAGLGSTLSAWKSSIKTRFAAYLNDKNLIVATYLDPRYKTTFLKEKYNSRYLADILLQWLFDDINIHYLLQNVHHPDSEISELTSPAEISPVDVEHGGTNDFNFNFQHCFNELMEKNNKQEARKKSKNTNANGVDNINKTTEDEIKNAIKLEMSKYESFNNIPNNVNPMTWWAANKNLFPDLSTVATKYLSAPPSSVESERCFSVGGMIYSPKRNRMHAETGEMLMFLHYNLIRFS